jgi:hypothetical protein
VPHSYLNERFHIDVRSSGYGVPFSSAIAIPAFFGVYMNLLAHIMALRAIPTVLSFVRAITFSAACQISCPDAAMRPVNPHRAT